MRPIAESPGGHLLANLVVFGRLLRRLGLDVTPARIELLARALGEIDLGDRTEVRDAARAVLVSRREHLERFERAFDLFFRERRPGAPREMGRMTQRVSRRQPQPSRHLALWMREGAGGAAGADDSGDAAAPAASPRAYSPAEALRRKDFAELTAAERAEVRRLIERAPWRIADRRTRRLAAAAAGRPDPRRLLRKSLRHGGEPLDLAWRRRRRRPRPLVVLCDISGSMESYARVLLRFVYALTRGMERAEAFVFGTRLTRITRELRRRDPDEALRRASEAAPDWAGGTRIGEAVKRFNWLWARRVLRQGAAVLVISDGWDRGDTDLLGREMARLARSCHRLIWLNPLAGRPGFQPLTRGLVAALPHVDDFLPVHDLASLDRLGEILAGLGRRPAAPARKETANA